MADQADSKTTTTRERDVLADRRDDKGGLIDPPNIPEFETRLRAAHDAADDVLIQDINNEYTKAREQLARDEVARDKRRRKLARERGGDY